MYIVDRGCKTCGEEKYKGTGGVVGKSGRKKELENPRRRWTYTIKIDFKKHNRRAWVRGGAVG